MATAFLNVTLPAHTLSAGIVALSAELPAHTLTSNNTTVEVASVSAVLPHHRLTATVATGERATLSRTLPAHTLAAYEAPHGVVATLPAHTLVATVLNGEVAGLARRLPAHTLAATAVGADTATVRATLPHHRLTASVSAGAVAELDLTLRAHRLVATVASGASASLNAELPVHTLAASGYAEGIATAVLTLPAHTLAAYVTSAVPASYRAWALNLHNKALTEYTGFAFNSFVIVDGRLYGATSSGIYELGAQSTDAGTAIEWALRTGKHNLGTTYVKRLPRLYAGIESAGDVTATTITSADGRRGYRLPGNSSAELQMRRVPIGRGPKSSYWQVELAGRSDVFVDGLYFYPEAMRRRVNG